MGRKIKHGGHSAYFLSENTREAEKEAVVNYLRTVMEASHCGFLSLLSSK